MYAQLIRSRTTEQKREEMHRLVSDELIPALRDEPGFAGALHLVNPGSGHAIVIVLWHSAEQAQRALGDNGTSSLASSLAQRRWPSRRRRNALSLGRHVARLRRTRWLRKVRGVAHGANASLPARRWPDTNSTSRAWRLTREETRTMEDIRNSRLRFVVSAVAAVTVAAGTAGVAAGRGDAAPAQKAQHASHLRRAGHGEQAQLKHGLLRVEGTAGK